MNRPLKTPTSIVITRERPDAPDAVALIAELDDHLTPLYPPQSCHGYSVQKLIDQQVAFFVLRADGAPAGCGGIQLVVGAEYGVVGAEYGELKRMYVRPQFRGLGFAARLVDHLIGYARAHGIGIVRLETGVRQTAAIRLYERTGFQRIGPFGDYVEDPLSLCYEKRLEP